MKISVQALSVDIFTHVLGNLSAILEKGAALAAAKKFDSSVLVSSRLAPDMLPLVKQVQIACDHEQCHRLGESLTERIRRVKRIGE